MRATASTAATAERLLRRPLPFGVSADRHRMGVRPVDASQWLELDGADAPAQLAEKRRIFNACRDQVLAGLPGSQEACEELLGLVRDQVGGISDELPRGRHPLEAAGRLAPEDFCVHLPDPATGLLTLVAGCVCFPNRWSLIDKLGRPVTAIHGPVPGYAAQLGRPVDRLMARLPEGRILERANWGVVHGGALFAPLRESQRRTDWEGCASDPWLRVERQTLRRLPVSGAVVFTIRTLTAPLAILDTDPEAAGLLAAAVRELPEDVARYKLGPPPARAAVLARLGARTEPQLPASGLH
jgi:hypothetical protein